MDNLEKINITSDGYVDITLKPPMEIDEKQFAIVNGNNNLLNCMRDREDTKKIFFDIKGTTPLDEYISSKSFDFAELKKLVLDLTSTLCTIKKSQLIFQNTIINSEFIFINNYDSSIKVINLPVSKSSCNNIDYMVKDLIKNIINNVKVKNSNGLIGYIFESLNSDKFNLEAFNKKLSLIKSESMLKKSEKNDKKFLVSNIITILCIAVSTIGGSFIGILLKIGIVTKYINKKSILIFAALIAIGIMLSFIINFILKITNKNKKVTIQNDNSNQNYHEIYTTSSISNLDENKGNYISSNDMSSNNTFKSSDIHEKSTIQNTHTGSFGSKEYNPGITNSHSIPTEEPKQAEGTSLLEVNEEDNSNSRKSSEGTQVLFEENTKLAFIIMKGNADIIDRIYIDSSNFIIGREKNGTNFTIMHSSISKKHAIIKSMQEEFYIEDLNSTNGTFLNGVRLAPKKLEKLNNGDCIAFGNQEYQFYL